MSEKLKLEVLMGLVEKVTGPLKNITKGSSTTAKALKAAKDELKQLNEAQKRIDGFRKIDKDLSIVKNGMKGAQDRIKALKQEIAKLPAPTKDMARALKEAQSEAAHLKGRYTSLLEKQQRLRTELNATGMDTVKLATHQRDLAGKINLATAAVDKQVQAMQRQNVQAQRMHAARAKYDKMIGVRNTAAGAGATSMATGAAIGMPILKTVKEFAIAEDASTQLKVAMMGVSGKVAPEFERINALATRLSNRLPGTTAEYKDMMTMLIRQGMSAKAILGGLGEATAYLGVQLKMPMTAAAEFASKLQDATRTGEKDMMGLMDVIQKTFYLGVDSNNMLDAFAKLSPALSTLRTHGLAATKALAPLLVMADQSGMKGEAAGNAYRKVFQYVMDIKRIGKANEVSGLGLDFTNGKGEFGGIDKMFAQMQKLKGLTTQKRLGVMKALFGDDAETLQAVSLLIDKGKAGYDEVQAKMAAQADLQRRVNEQLGTLSALWEAASGTFSNALVAIGETISPEIKALTQWINDVSVSVQDWTKKHPELAGVLMKTAGILAIVMVAVGALGLGFAAIAGPLAVIRFGFSSLPAIFGPVLKVIGSLANAFMWVARVFLFVGRLFLTNPILLAITLIATAAYLIYKNWGAISTFFKELWGGIVSWFGGLPARFMNVGAAIVDGIWSGLKRGWGVLVSGIKSLAGLLPAGVRKVLGIKSPSTVFNVIGRYTMAGLSGGIDAGRQRAVSAVSNAARKVAATGAGVLLSGAAMAGPAIDTRPALSGPGGGAAAGGGNTFIFQIHAAPGMDEEALARAVERKFRQIESQRAARGRSLLSDRE